MADNVNVLDVLRDYCSQHGEPDDFSGAVAMLAELIAADVEYDAARSIHDALQDGMSTIGEVVIADARLRRAKERRAAALSACTGGSNG